MTSIETETARRRRPGRLALAAAVFAGLTYVGGWSAGPAPALGPFLDPVRGVWEVARSARLPGQAAGTIPGLGDQVRVVYDTRGVPHIWAASMEDAVRALGFVVARDRLFQLEIQSRAPEGTLSELVGPGALGLDRHQRGIGLPWAAERDARSIARGSETDRLLRAYAEGVNAWIDALGDRVPFEYHLLGTRPRRWDTIHSLLISKRMGYTLAYDTQDLWRLRIEALVGKDAADALFPLNSPIVEPIQPNGSRTPRFDTLRLPPPIASDAAVVRASRQLAAAFDPPAGAAGSSAHRGRELSGGDAIGSNNWAVAPARSANGRALLSGDPHLQLTLPSIWYEVHVVVPGELDVAGVTIPGLPGVIIGYNRDVAWSFTNTGADVVDFYRETFDDPGRPSRYRLDGEWEPLHSRVETYRGPGGGVLAVDTMVYTHRGPARSTEDGPVSMRWTVLDTPFTFEVFTGAARATTVKEWLDAMAGYAAPAQNGIVADREGAIAIRSTGLFPIRPADGDGRVIRSGSSSENDWRGYWPAARYPFSRNPRQGFLASANQQPLDPRTDGGYLGANWPTPWRALRINQLLRADTQVTVDDMRRFHTDPGNAKADLFVPAFLDAVQGRSTVGEAAARLRTWDRRYTKDSEGAILFEYAMGELARRVWDELTDPETERVVRFPSQAVLARLLASPDNVWWDDRRTPGVVETRDDLLAASLAAAFERARREFGEPDAGGWRWDRIRHANVFHLTRLAALSILDVPVQGGSGNLNPSSGDGTHGASWRMVVELGPTVRAWATYPGGQSGNPASPWYGDRMRSWANGELQPTLFPQREEDLDRENVASVLTLRNRP